MSKVKTRLSFTGEDLRRAIELDPKIMNLIGELMVFQLVFLIQGKSRKADKSGRVVRMPSLSQTYRDYRQGKYYFDFNDNGKLVKIKGRDPNLKLSSKTKPRQKSSNLTLTGELMSSLTYKHVRARDSIEIFFKGSHSKAEMTNQELIELLISRNSEYEVMKLSNTMIRMIREQIIKYIARKLRNFSA